MPVYMAWNLCKGPGCIHVQGGIKAGLFHFTTGKTETRLESAACWGPWKRQMVGAGQGRMDTSSARVERPQGGAGCGPISQASASMASPCGWTLGGNGHHDASIAFTSEGYCEKLMRKCR